MWQDGEIVGPHVNLKQSDTWTGILNLTKLSAPVLKVTFGQSTTGIVGQALKINIVLLNYFEYVWTLKLRPQMVTL